MRKLAIVLALTLCASLASMVPSGARGPRKASLPYSMEDRNHHVGVPGLGAGVYDTEDSYTFQLRRGERSISVQVFDDTEEPVSGSITQWVTDFESNGASTGHAVTYVRFCGETDRPVRVKPRIPVEIFLNKGTCEDGTPSLPTNGDIAAEFFRK